LPHAYVNLRVFQTFETDAAETRPGSITYFCRCPEQRKHPDNFTTRSHIKKPKEEEITVIVNTAEDTWVSGNLVCPDIDTVLYLFADTIDAEKWWGIRDDTFTTNDSLKRAGHPEIMRIGDKDRATHNILRSDLIRKGCTPTEAIRELACSSGIRGQRTCRKTHACVRIRSILGRRARMLSRSSGRSSGRLYNRQG